MTRSLPVALVTGVGPGTGAAIARRFARGGYAVAMLARNQERLDALEREIENSRGYPCDVTDEKQLDAAIERVRAELGAPIHRRHRPEWIRTQCGESILAWTRSRRS